MYIRNKLCVICIVIVITVFTSNPVLGNVDDTSNSNMVELEEDLTSQEVRIGNYIANNEFYYQYDTKTLTASVAGYMGSQTTISIPEYIIIEGVTYTITAIEPYSFYQKNLTSVNIPNSIISIGSHAFYQNELAEIRIPDSVISIGSYAFWRNQIRHVDIANSVKSIGRSAFRDNQLISVVIPNSITTIEEQTFANNNITNVVLPSTLTFIGNSIFLNNPLEILFVENGDATRIKDILDIDAMRGITADATFIFESSSHYHSDVSLVNTVPVGESLSFTVIPQIKYSFDKNAITWTTHTPVVQWYKDGEVLTEQMNLQLTLNDLQVEDTGIYYAIVDTATLPEIQVNVTAVESSQQPNSSEQDTNISVIEHDFRPVQTADKTSTGTRNIIKFILSFLSISLIAGKKS